MQSGRRATLASLTEAARWMEAVDAEEGGDQTTESPNSGQNDKTTTVNEELGGVTMAYQLEGRLLEVCTCNVLCPCWVGEDPDNGTCDGLVAWHFDKGTIEGVDVAGLSLVAMAHIPGNVLQGNWRVVAYVDDKATDKQQEALLKVFSGQLGGPVADLVQLIGEMVGVERAPITFEVQEGKGVLRIGQAISAELAPFRGATGQPTTLNESIFTSIPGSPAYVGKATSYKANVPALGISLDLQGHNAIQGSFRFEA